jgi:hypothetical protein
VIETRTAPAKEEETAQARSHRRMETWLDLVQAPSRFGKSKVLDFVYSN